MRAAKNKESKLLPLREIAVAMRAKYGRTVDISTLGRWINHGVRGKKLKATAIGARWYCDLETVASFISAISEPRTSEMEAVAC